MPQTIPSPSFLTLTSLYLSQLQNAPRTIPIITYKAIANASTDVCNYTEIGNDTMDLERAVLPAPSDPTTYTFFDCKAIAVYCRPKYNSSQFPDNPKFPRL